MAQASRDRGTRTVLVIAGLYLLLGLIYAYSVVLAPVKEQFAWSVPQMTAVFTCSILCFIGGSLLAARVLARLGLARTLGGGALLLLSGFLGCALCPVDRPYPCVLGCYGVVASLGIGVVYNTLLPLASAWHPRRSGLAQGVCLMGFGLGGFVLGPLLTALYQLFPWRPVLAGCGLVLAGATVGTARWVRAPRPEEVPCVEAHAERPVPAARAVVGTPTYRSMFCFLFLLGSVGMAVTGVGRELPALLTADALACATTIGFLNVGSGVGRLTGGLLADRRGHAVAMRVAAGLCLGAVGLLGLSLFLGSLPLMALALFALGCGWGTDVVMMTFVAQEAWGQESLALTISLLNANSVLAALVGSAGTGFLVGATGSLDSLLALAAVFSAAAWPVSCLVSRSLEPPIPDLTSVESSRS